MRRATVLRENDKKELFTAEKTIWEIFSKFGTKEQKRFAMCGVAGYIGSKRAGPILLEALRSLEYRGYDSFGLATMEASSESGCKARLHVRRFLGSVGNAAIETVENLPGVVGIAHTRWATHGLVTLANAHPQLDCRGSVAVVHNGIIENSDRLREFLQKRGHRFKSQTDTEVISHLIEDQMQQCHRLEEAVRLVTRRITGSSSFIVLSVQDPEHILAVKAGLPLAVGYARNAHLISSDPSSFPPWVEGVSLLQDGDLAIVGRSAARIVDVLTGVERKRDVTWRQSWRRNCGRKGYRHYMEKEIHEQPSILKKISEEGVNGLEHLARSLEDAERIFLIGSGTSYHSCVTGSYFLNDLAELESRPLLASTFPRFASLAGDADALIAVSQSGETADILDAVAAAKKAGMKVYSITNNEASTLGRLSEVTVDIAAGSERGVAATKTYTAQLAVFYLLAAQVRGKLREGTRELSETSLSISRYMSRFIRQVKLLARKLCGHHLILLIGRDAAYPTAMEGALKIREISYVPALGLEGSELKHGNLALITDGVPCFVFSPYGDHLVEANASEAQSRGADVIWVTDQERDRFGQAVRVPFCGTLFPIPAIIPMQLLAYEMAILRGNNPDRPRNLAKCVTVR